jgi:hypothetical protein
MFFGKPGTNTDPDTDAGGAVLENLAVDSLKTKDVIIYSGPFYGFALANWRKTSATRSCSRKVATRSRRSRTSEKPARPMRTVAVPATCASPQGRASARSAQQRALVSQRAELATRAKRSRAHLAARSTVVLAPEPTKAN